MGFNYYSVSWWSNWWTISWTRDVYSFMIWTPSWFNITCNYVWASCWPVPCITTSVNVCCATTASVYFSSFSNNCIYGWSYFTFFGNNKFFNCTIFILNFFGNTIKSIWTFLNYFCLSSIHCVIILIFGFVVAWNVFNYNVFIYDCYNWRDKSNWYGLPRSK